MALFGLRSESGVDFDTSSRASMFVGDGDRALGLAYLVAYGGA